MYQPDIFVNILIYQNDCHLLCTKSEAEYERAYSQAIADVGILENHLKSIKVPYGIQDRASQLEQPNSYFTPGYQIIRADIDAIWEVSIVATRCDFQHFLDEDLLNNKIVKSIRRWVESMGDLMRIEFCQDFESIAKECRGASNSDDIGLIDDPFWDEYPLIVVSYDDRSEKAVGRFSKQVAQTICDIVSEAWYPLNDFIPYVCCKDDRGFFEEITPSRDVLKCINGFAFVE